MPAGVADPAWSCSDRDSVNTGEEDETSRLVGPGAEGRDSCLRVMMKMKHVLLGLVAIYTVTLTIFPGVLAEDIPVSEINTSGTPFAGGHAP